MVFDNLGDFPLLTPQSPLLLLSPFPEEVQSLALRAGTASYVLPLWDSTEPLTQLAAILGPRLLVPEKLAQALPQCGVLIPSSISGGEFRQRLLEAAERYPRRCWLLLEQLCMEFPLPCPSGNGTELPPKQLEALLLAHPSFYDPGLCCRYCHYSRDGSYFMTLFDTADTSMQKAALAKEAGFSGAVSLQPSAEGGV